MLLSGTAGACDLGLPTSEAGAERLIPQFGSFDGSDWSAPVNLGPVVNTAFIEQQAALSRDGLELYFTSNRPGGLGGNDIWVSHRASLDSPWEAPVNLGAPVNSSSSDASPGFSVDGHLMFFQSDRPGSQGMSDIYVTRRTQTHDDFGWETPTPIGLAVNTALFEGGSKFLQSAEEGKASLYFGRGPIAQDLDLYYAVVNRDGTTQGDPVLITELSLPSPVTEGHASVRVDGREVIFFSNRPGTLGSTDLWVSTRQSIHHPWRVPQNLGAPINSAVGEAHPSMSLDGRTLVFTSARPGGLGGNDLWMSTRTPNPH